MNAQNGEGYIWAVADLPRRRDARFEITPDAQSCAALAEAMGLESLKKLRFAGQLRPEGKADWRLEAQIGATVTQPCVVTLAPVTSRIDEPVSRRFLANPEDDPAAGSETEMSIDEGDEALGREIDLWAVMIEALSLALPAYPRADGAALGSAQYAEPGVTPMSDEAARPFSGLADLKAKLEKKD
ncbi:MAG: DUF177 domain-containing protein [Mangrovicoccus sp.]|nr:DUF177 domain-containing protein [Mangrovicoccus sp.]